MAKDLTCYGCNKIFHDGTLRYAHEQVCLAEVSRRVAQELEQDRQLAALARRRER